MTPSEALGHLFAFPVGRKLKAKRQRDGAAVIVTVVGRSVAEDAEHRETFLKYTLRGEAGTVQFSREHVETTMEAASPTHS